ncbi:hypothetical protein [Phenylobacterium sp.]|uniref:hypothetical protein n=1 Tax=Phenylobacterium sp. TaxID=1871053 RepID=UPI00286C519C|nr:hypothetical protein [Phenylobacterium sp.]
MAGNPAGGAGGTPAGGGQTAQTAGGTPANLAWGGVGLVAGAITTLVGDLGVKQLLDNNPYIGLAIFCLLAASIIFIAGLVGRSTGRTLTSVAVMAGLMVVAAGAFGGFSAYVAPQKLEILVSPQAEGVPAIEIVGKERQDLKWETAVDYRIDGRRTLNLSASRFQKHYEAEMQKINARCVDVIATTSGDSLGVGSSLTGY